MSAVPKGLVRYQQTGNLHFVTFSCYRRLPYLGTPALRELFEESLEKMRIKYDFYLNAYVVMPARARERATANAHFCRDAMGHLPT
jgi:hypothetical protein